MRKSVACKEQSSCISRLCFELLCLRFRFPPRSTVWFKALVWFHVEMSTQEKLDICSSVTLSLRWTLHNAIAPNPKRIESSIFRFEGGGWKLTYLYDPKRNYQYSLSLARWSGVSPSEPVCVWVQVESSERGRIVQGLSDEGSCTDKFQRKNVCFGIWQKKEEDILEALPEIRRSGVLKFFVVLKTEDVKSQTEDAPDCLESLSHDFTNLLLDKGSNPDVKFQCSGQSIGAHGAVVSVRSKVFASMLSSDMPEGRTRVIEIPDIELDVFRDFLLYIYTGTVSHLTLDLALSLYKAGERYSVMGLARRCSKFLLKNLTIDNACGVLLVADAHSDKGFKEAVVRFMVDKEVPRVSSCWTEFYSAHPTLAAEVLNRCCIGVTN